MHCRCRRSLWQGPLGRPASESGSSENTDLQPSRYYDPTMSGSLRYLDAEKNDVDLRVTRDAYPSRPPS
jgi:hypothetical protein